jgi:hypothetical protein
MRGAFDRYDWSALGADRLPERITELAACRDHDRANLIMCEVEAETVPVNGPPQPAAAAAAAVLVRALPTAAAREEILVLLATMAFAGVADAELRREVSGGLPVYAEIVETGTIGERAACVDLLSCCTRYGGEVGRRSVDLLHRMAEFGGPSADSVAVELADLAQDGHITA